MTPVQFIVALLLTIGGIVQCFLMAIDREQPPARVAMVVIWEILYRITFAFLLHWGGFW